MTASELWIVVNSKTGKSLRHLGVHGTREAAQAILDQYFDAFDVNLRNDFEVRAQDPSDEWTSTPLWPT